MHRQPYDEHDDMKVGLGEQEVEQFLDVPDTTRRIAFGLGLRSGLWSDEIVQVTPADVVDGPAGTMVRVREAVAKGGKYHEMPLPPDLAPSRPSTTYARGRATHRSST